MADKRLDVEPGFFENDGRSQAMVEQQRAEMISLLRNADAVSMTVLNPDDSNTHWALYNRDDNDADSFLVLAVVKTVRDAAAAMSVDHSSVMRLALVAISQGIGG